MDGAGQNEAFKLPIHKHWYERIVKERGEVVKVRKVKGLAPEEE